MFALDAALGNVLRTTREQMLGRIRYAWWRERLQELDEGIVPAEPVLEGAARIVETGRLDGNALAQLVDRWEPLLEDMPWEGEVTGAIFGRGAFLFGYAGLLLSADLPGIKLAQVAGSLWTGMDFAKHCTDADERDTIIDVAHDTMEKFGGGPVEMAVRPLTMLGLLARRDLERWPEIEPQGTPARAWLMIHHRLTGKL